MLVKNFASLLQKGAIKALLEESCSQPRISRNFVGLKVPEFLSSPITNDTIHRHLHKLEPLRSLAKVLFSDLK